MTVVVTDQGDGAQGASPDFAAGVAAATAVTAAQTAAEAEQTADVAVAIAEQAAAEVATARTEAIDAEITAAMAMEAVADLEDRVFAAFGDLVGEVAELVEETAPPADVVVSGEGNTVDVDDQADKPKSKKAPRGSWWATRL